jgi:DnaA family protein
MTGQLALNFPLAEDATFANYVGDAAQKLRALSGVCYVWGEAESGRSHLLQACCHTARENGQSAIYLEHPAEHDADILDGLESVAVVCIDDVDSVLAADKWQLGLFQLINAVQASGGCLVFSAHKPAMQLQRMLPDLHSRLLAAVAIETDRLTDAQKLTALKQRAFRHGFTLNDEVGHFLMGRVPRSMRSLMSLLERIEVETLVRQKKVTIPLVKQTLGI